MGQYEYCSVYECTRYALAGVTFWVTGTFVQSLDVLDINYALWIINVRLLEWLTLNLDVICRQGRSHYLSSEAIAPTNRNSLPSNFGINKDSHIFKGIIWINRYVGHSKSNETVFSKNALHFNPDFLTNIFKFSSASFKTNITFCYLDFKFWFFAKSISEMYTPSIGVGKSLAFYFIYENKLAESII